MSEDISGALSEKRRKLRSQKAVAVRLGRTDDARRLDSEIRTERLAHYIAETVDSPPALTPEQRDRLALLLRGSVA